MPCVWKYPRVGYRWALTELGFEIGRIRAKYELSYSQRALYEQRCPKSWVDSGYVREVPREVN